jgi:hypothetical protein
MKSLIETIVTDMSTNAFFKELSFTSQQLALPSGATEELADFFVWLETDGIIIQVKERDEKASVAPEAFDNWFKRKVLGKGSDQIAASISFFRQHPHLQIKNCRGAEFELCELDSETMCKVVIFGTLADNMDQYHRPKYHHSVRSGFIHIINAVDFTNLLHWLVTPGEMLAYLRFREEHLREHEDARQQTEKWLFGSFVHWSTSGQTPKLLSTAQGEGVIESIVDDTDDIRITQFLDCLGDWAEQHPDKNKVFSKLVLECARLTRVGFREFKLRIKKCLSRLDQPAPKSLYRIHNEERDCVFAFGVLPSNTIDKNEIGAANYTYLLKYSCRAPKAIGMFFTKCDDDNIAITPVYLEMAWQLDPDAENCIEMLQPYLRPLVHRASNNYRIES